MSSPLKSGWATLIRFRARCLAVWPRSLATPNSVTTWSTSFLLVVTDAAGARVGTMHETVPFLAVDAVQINALPPRDLLAPRAKSA